MRFTRRKLAAALLGPAVALPQQQPPPLPRTPEEELEAARAQLRATAEALSKVPLAMAVEPACHFKA